MQDSLAIVDFYNSTDGPHWTHHDNWLIGPVSKWYGIKVTGTRVTSIDLGGNNLTGHIPSSLGNLEKLVGISLGYNQLSDSIPSSLGNLTNLESLYLYYNQLSGIIPSSFGDLTNLEFLHLYNNQLSGSIPSSLGNLTNVRQLYLDYNELSGSIPASLGNLTNLEYLYLWNNWLSGSIPSSLGNLINLYDLLVYNNELSGSIPSSLGNLVNLVSLDLSHNRLSGSIPSSLGNLTNLTGLSLQFNQFSGSIPSSLGNLIYMLRLYLNNNELSGAIPSEVGKLNHLYSINISYNRFTFDGMELIAQKFPFVATYAPQASIHVHQNDSSLTISAGGTLSKNIYKWFKVGGGITTIRGDSVFHPTQSGNYFASVTNSICTQLTLHTDTVFYNGSLPVTILDLKAYPQGKQNRVNWTSVTEINIDNYEIQRSSNATDFITIGSIKAINNGTEKTAYSFNDVKPLLGNNYYRLKIFDNDGTITYSNIVLAKVENDKITLIYPVPAKNILTVQTNAKAQFSLRDQSGRIILITTINEKGTIDVSHLDAGTYFLRNDGTGEVQTVLIMK